MSGKSRHIVITGASGYIGGRLAQRILTEPAFANDRITLTDISAPQFAPDPRVRLLAADLTRDEDVTTMLDGRVDILFHIAGILGGAAESNYDLSRRVNVDATLSLLERVRDAKAPPRVVFASSVAVFGPPLPEEVNDETLPLPTMVYGAQKRMLEVVIEQFSARGWIEGIALRLPGIVARADADMRMKSAFLNSMFFDYADGRDFVLPVSPQGTTWLISVEASITAFLHAATLPADRMGKRRALTLPAQCVQLQEIVATLAKLFPESPSTVRYEPVAELDAQFASLPPLSTALCDEYGFQHDGDLETLVRRALSTRDVPLA